MEKEIMNNEELKVVADKVAEMVNEQLKNLNYVISLKPKEIVKFCSIGALTGVAFEIGSDAVSALRKRMELRKLKKNAKKNAEQAAETLKYDYPEEESEE